jgi:hypothetical protein
VIANVKDLSAPAGILIQGYRAILTPMPTTAITLAICQISKSTHLGTAQ